MIIEPRSICLPNGGGKIITIQTRPSCERAEPEWMSPSSSIHRPELRSLLKWVISDPIEIKIKIG